MREVAAGGLVYRWEKGELWLLMILDQYGHWTWPKGLVEEGESLEEAAVREVGEETGLEVDSKEALTPVTYWYTRRGQRIHKEVHFFLMTKRGGRLRPQLEEIADVQWVTVDEVLRRLSYENSREMVEEARRKLENCGAAQ